MMEFVPNTAMRTITTRVVSVVRMVLERVSAIDLFAIVVSLSVHMEGIASSSRTLSNTTIVALME